MKLRSELDQRNKVLIDKTKLLQLEEEKRRIEEDKNKVMELLKKKSN
jgi:chromosome segregation ATPase